MLRGRKPGDRNCGGNACGGAGTVGGPFPDNAALRALLPALVLVALAAQIATVAVTVYLGEIGTEEEREYFVATSRFVRGVIGTAVAAVLGLLAQIHDDVIPIAVILTADAAALAVVLLVQPERPEKDNTS